MTPPALTITNEQANSLPLLLGLIVEMGIRDLIDAQITPHGNWEGASVGTVLSIWLSHILQERDHCMVPVRDWTVERTQTLNTLLGISLRETDCSDDRLASILTLLGDPHTQAALGAALMARWLRVYHLPRNIVRLDSTSVSVYHDDVAEESLLQKGYSKEHRPDLRQFKLMLATLDPLGLPIACQPIPGNQGDDPLYIPAYDAAVAALGTSDVLAVGDSKMAALATRGHLVAHGSRYSPSENVSARPLCEGNWRSPRGRGPGVGARRQGQLGRRPGQCPQRRPAPRRRGSSGYGFWPA